jgi:hypothetical protein
VRDCCTSGQVVSSLVIESCTSNMQVRASSDLLQSCGIRLLAHRFCALYLHHRPTRARECIHEGAAQAGVTLCRQVAVRSISCLFDCELAQRLHALMQLVYGSTVIIARPISLCIEQPKRASAMLTTSEPFKFCAHLTAWSPVMFSCIMMTLTVTRCAVHLSLLIHIQLQLAHSTCWRQ